MKNAQNQENETNIMDNLNNIVQNYPKHNTAEDINVVTDVDAWWDHTNEESGAAQLVSQCQETYGWGNKWAVKVLTEYRNFLEQQKQNEASEDVAFPRRPVYRMWKVHSSSERYELQCMGLIGRPLPFLPQSEEALILECKHSKRHFKCGRRDRKRHYGGWKRDNSDMAGWSSSSLSSDSDSSTEGEGESEGATRAKMRHHGRRHGRRSHCGKGMRFGGGGGGRHGRCGRKRYEGELKEEAVVSDEKSACCCHPRMLVKRWKRRASVMKMKRKQNWKKAGMKVVGVKVQIENDVEIVECPLHCRMRRVYKILSRKLGREKGSFVLLNQDGKEIPMDMRLEDFNLEDIVVLSNARPSEETAVEGVCVGVGDLALEEAEVVFVDDMWVNVQYGNNMKEDKA